MVNEDQDVSMLFQIESPTLTVSSGGGTQEAKPRRGRPPKSAAKISDSVSKVEESVPKVSEVKRKESNAGNGLIRVTPSYSCNLYCHTQQKMLYAGFETLVLRDSWISNQIRKGILKVVG